jgi:hypothetical protein
LRLIRCILSGIILSAGFAAAQQPAPQSANPQHAPQPKKIYRIEVTPSAEDLHQKVEARPGSLLAVLQGLQQLKNAKIDADFRGGKILLHRLSADIGLGHIELQGPIDFSNSSAVQHVHVVIENVTIVEFASAFGLSTEFDLNGLINAEFDFGWNGLSTNQLLKSAEGSGSVRVEEVDVGNWKALDKLAQKTGIDRLRRLEHLNGTARFSAKNGVLKLTQAQLENTDARIEGTGGALMTAQKIRFRVNLALNPKLAAESRRDDVRALARLVSPQDSKQLVPLPVPILIEGNAHHPDVGFDTKHARAEDAIPLALDIIDSQLDRMEEKPDRDSKDKEKARILKKLKGQLKD